MNKYCISISLAIFPMHHDMLNLELHTHIDNYVSGVLYLLKYFFMQKEKLINLDKHKDYSVFSGTERLAGLKAIY